MSIFLFTRSIRTGKTTELKAWCDKQDFVAGVLMPDLDGIRKIQNIRTRILLDAQCISDDTDENALIRIGRFSFYRKAFEEANQWLLEELTLAPHWLVLDEAGKLEIESTGFHEALQKIIAAYQAADNGHHLLIVVREGLVEKIIAHYAIKNPVIVSSLQDL